LLQFFLPIYCSFSYKNLAEVIVVYVKFNAITCTQYTHCAVIENNTSEKKNKYIGPAHVAY